jgi:hypothetical protein
MSLRSRSLFGPRCAHRVARQRSTTRRPLPSPGFPTRRFPCFSGTMRRSDSLRPSLRASFSSAWRYPAAASVLRSARSDADRRPGTIRVWPSRRGHHNSVATIRVSHVHGEPAVLLPGSSTPANRTRLAKTACPTWPPQCKRRRLPQRTTLSGLNRQASALAVYASPAELLQHDARLASAAG